MSRKRKVLLIVPAIFFGLIALAIAYTQVSAEMRLRRKYDIAVNVIPIPTDEEAIERGRGLVISGRCTECHGIFLGGAVVADSSAVGTIYASNLTSGEGGVANSYTDEDWIRALRHGVGQDGRSLVITPAQYYYYLSDEDLGAIIAYIKSVSPVNNEQPSPAVGPLTRMFISLFGSAARDWLPAEKIDHESPRPQAPDPGVTVEYGEYLVRTKACLGCHSSVRELSAESGGDLHNWNDTTFISSVRSSGDSDMSKSIRPLSDDELQAIWLYLQTLSPDESDIRD
jgi:mono/diheme cytochrome c family protein